MPLISTSLKLGSPPLACFSLKIVNTYPIYCVAWVGFDILEWLKWAHGVGDAQGNCCDYSWNDDHAIIEIPSELMSSSMIFHQSVHEDFHLYQRKRCNR